MQKLKVMKKVFYISLILFLAYYTGFSQTRISESKKESSTKILYHPDDDAKAKIDALIVQAQKEHKNIILQGGGNWCVWCWRFDEFWQEDSELANLVENNYLYYHLNWSPENKNEELFTKYGNPGKKYGYPVLIFLDQNGKQIHTQNTGDLEEGKSYDKAKVKAVFEKWKPSV